MRNRSTRLTLVLLLSILMVLSTVPLQPEYTINDPVIQDSKIDNGNSEPLILTSAQQSALERVTGRSGTTNWVKVATQASGTANDQMNINSVQIESVIMDHTNTNILVGGTLRGTVSFDTNVPPHQDDPKAFVASLSQSGTWNWVSTTGVPQGHAGSSILADLAVSSNGTIWVVGTYWDEIEWGNDFEMSDGGSIDGFVATMSSTGTWYWGNTMHGISNSDSMHGIVLDSNDDAYVVGAFSDHVYFDNSSFNICLLYTSDAADE